MLVPTKARYTPEDLARMSESNGYELIDGELVERIVSAEASCVSVHVVCLLQEWSDSADAGLVLEAGCTYQCFPEHPERVRRSSVSYIRRGRLTHEQYVRDHTPIVPDLAVDVVSPDDLVTKLIEKIEEFLAAGVRSFWVVHPRTRTLYIYRADGTARRFREEDEVTDESVLPGFRCKVADFFPPEALAEDS